MAVTGRIAASRPTPRVLARSGDEYLVAGVVHCHTTFSDGQHRPENLVALAHEKGLGVVVITDHHFESWRYRFGIRVNRRSVLDHGTKAYLDAIHAAALQTPGPIVCPGIEVVPQYRWAGIPPFLRCLVAKTAVIYGIEDAGILDQLPVRLDGKGRSEAESTQIAQSLIDYVGDHGGLFYWSHLETAEKTSFLTASLQYRPNPELLQNTRRYTGFGCFPGGTGVSTEAGGYWDQRLGEAVAAGTRNGPWVLGEADFHRGDSDEPYQNICNPTTVFSLSDLNAPAVTDALAHGRMYAYRGRHFDQSLLEVYSITFPNGGAVAKSGQTLRGRGTPWLQIRVSGFQGSCVIRVVCDGRLLYECSGRELEVRLPAPDRTGYACRAEIVSPAGERIMTNPIFVLGAEDF